MTWPIETSDLVPEGTIYMFPSDVTQALANTNRAGNAAIVWMFFYLFAPMLWPTQWRHVRPTLETNARRAFNDFENHALSTERIIHKAAAEKRIGVITNIGEPK